MGAGPATTVPFNDLRRQHEPLSEKLREAFERVAGSSAFVLGEEVEGFEAEFAQSCGARSCVGVASGTAALTIMLRAAGLGAGDEVIVPAHTFLASALSVLHAGAEPVCVDVEPGTGLLDPAAVRAAVGPRTAAVLAVHLYGQSCDMGALKALCDSHGLILLEDAAQAHGATYKGTACGALGLAGAFSFYPSKNLGALGDGGAICTNDAELADRARQWRDLGRSPDGSHEVAGYNERLDGLQAAFLRAKLPHLADWNNGRREVAGKYRRWLSGVELLDEGPESPCVYHLFPIRIGDRERLVGALRDAEIATGIHYPLALPDQPALAGLGDADVPVARDWAARELSLPMFPELTEAEIQAVVEAVCAAAQEG